MFNAIIRFSLRHRLLVAAGAILLMAYGAWITFHLPIDVLPNLNRPRVTVMTECPGMAPEEVETRVTTSLESVLNGATGVLVVRSHSTVGLSIINVEFDWGTDPYKARQIVNEKLSLATGRMPEGIKPQLAPISSVMGQIMILGMYSETNEKTLLFEIDGPLEDLLEEMTPEEQDRRKLTIREADQISLLSQRLRQAFSSQKSREILLSAQSYARPDWRQGRWIVVEPDQGRQFLLAPRGDVVEVHEVCSPMTLRTIADWEVRRRLLTVSGVAEIFVMGGERMQFQVLVRPDALLEYGVTLHEVEQALGQSNQNVTGGYLTGQGVDEYLVRSLGRIQEIEDLESLVVKGPVLLKHLAQIVEAPQVARGDSAAYFREPNGEFSGGRAVVLTIEKQPEIGTQDLTREIHKKLDGMMPSLTESYPDLRIESLYQQKDFIDLAVKNVIEALSVGAVLVFIVLVLFLMNVRTTFITLTAMPLSILITCLVFARFGLSINTMTLGGLAVAIGELVDDAIVDVENIFRRLRENAQAERPKSAIRVVFEASCEIRNSIVFGTFIVVLVFMPLFWLGGIEGRLFAPLGIAYIVSILSSLLVSLTVTPILAYWLLPGVSLARASRDGLLLRAMKWLAAVAIKFSLNHPKPVLISAMVLVAGSVAVFFQLERKFLPDFNEGTIQLNVNLLPGKSLETSVSIAQVIEDKLRNVEGVRSIVRKTGRAELDEHAVPVNKTEIIVTLEPGHKRSRSQQEITAEMRAIIDAPAAPPGTVAPKVFPGTIVDFDQPLQHLLAHLQSGSNASIVIKLWGDDLTLLRAQSKAVKEALEEEDMEWIVGKDYLRVEPIQSDIPQLKITLNRQQLALHGLTPGSVNELIETAMQGRVVTEVLDRQRAFDVMLRMGPTYREDLEALRHMSILLPNGGTIPLEAVATIDRSARGPYQIDHEGGRRQVTVQYKPPDRAGRAVADAMAVKLQPVVKDIRQANGELTMDGLFKTEQKATWTLGLLSAFSLIGVFLLLFTMFRSANLSLQVMCSLPMALIGAMIAIKLTGQDRTIPCLVGLISLCGIASRNGILLLNHYIHLVKFEGETWSREMLVRAGQERVAPVLMTALTSALGLVPLTFAADEPGKEILYPIATVVVGGLITSTLMEFLVRPALFWTFGRKAAERAILRQLAEDETFEDPANMEQQTSVSTIVP